MIGSKDNISAVVVRLPACVIRLASNGGVDAIRAKRTEEQAKVAIAANPTDSNN